MSRPLLHFLLLAVVDLIPLHYAAASMIDSYAVSHAFTFTPDGGVTSPVTYMYSVSALSATGTPQATSGSLAIGFGGGTASKTAQSTDSSGQATANSNATVNSFSSGGPVAGNLDSDGLIAVINQAICCALSTSAIIIDGDSNFHHGSADYAPEMSMRGYGGPEPGDKAEDPIAFKATDLKTGAITQGQLFEVLADLNGASTWSWNATGFNVNATNFDFSININSAFTTQQGTATLAIRNGVITTSTGTGMFSGLFPSVGTPGNFSTSFSNSFHLNYDLGTFGGDPTAIEFTFGNSGSSCQTPELSTFELITATLALGLFYRSVRCGTVCGALG
jgi:hypothetical protein